MARMARAISSTGIYHVMLRGIDKREIFVQPSDYEKFLWYVQIVKEKANLSLFAYCLMTNHVHLLLKTDEEEIGDIIKCIAVGYAQYHNIKYGRTGHLFQNRFRSETVDNDNYFLTVLRYIHQNPVKAGLVNNISDYRWSSYGTYIYGKTKLVDTKYALGYFKDIGDFSRFMRQDNADECLEYVQKKRWLDDELKEYIACSLDLDKLDEMDKEARNTAIQNIRNDTGASNRQLSRVLNICRKTLDKI